MDLLKKINSLPEQFPGSTNSKWIRIYFLTGKSVLGYYNYKEEQWREFNDISNLHNTSIIKSNVIKGWHY